MNKALLLLFCLLSANLPADAAPSAPPVRVALMDFSTDDNSWHSAQAAANFTSLLQIQLADAPGFEWVQRAQLEMFPQYHEADEAQQQQRGVHTPLMEAQAHGFPKGIPRDVVLKWKTEVEAELAERKKQVSEYAQSSEAPCGSIPRRRRR